MIRAFFSIPVPDAVTTKLMHDTAALRRQTKVFTNWASPSKWHITIKFFETIHPETLLKIAKVTSSLARETRPFELKIRKIAIFPTPNSRIIAAYVVPHRILRSLHRRLDNLGEKHGLRPEGRRFRPHITLAKQKGPSHTFEPLVYAGLTMQVKELLLYESKLHHQESEYLLLRRFELREP